MNDCLTCSNGCWQLEDFSKVWKCTHKSILPAVLGPCRQQSWLYHVYFVLTWIDVLISLLILSLKLPQSFCLGFSCSWCGGCEALLEKKKKKAFVNLILENRLHRLWRSWSELSYMLCFCCSWWIIDIKIFIYQWQSTTCVSCWSRLTLWFCVLPPCSQHVCCQGGWDSLPV